MVEVDINVDEAAQHAHAERRIVIAVLTGIVAYALLQSMLVPVLPQIRDRLEVSQADAAWVLSGFLLASAVCTPILGRLGDIRGLKNCYLFALACLSLGAIVAAFAPNLTLTVAGRIMQGVGGAIIPLAYGIIRAVLPRERLPGVIGLVGGVAGISHATGTVLAGVIMEYLGYQVLYLLPALCCVVSGILVAIAVPRVRPATTRRLNVPAALLLAIWLGAGLVAVSQGAVWGWTSAQLLIAIGVTVACAILWMVTELRSKNPLIDVRMMRNRPVAVAHAVSTLTGFSLFGVFALLPAYLQVDNEDFGFGLTGTAAGFFLLALSLGMFTMGFVSGRLLRFLRSRKVTVAGTSVVAMSLAGMAFWNHSPATVWALSLTLGLGFGVCFPALSTVVVMSVELSDTAQASGVNANLRTVGGAIGTAAVTLILTMTSTSDAYLGYVIGFLVLSGAAAGAALCALALPRHRHGSATSLRGRQQAHL
ncbi:MFS transporter [Rhodococcus koreensis]